MQCSSAPTTGISVVHSSDTSSQPRLRAARAGKSLTKSGVTVKIALITSDAVSPLRDVSSFKSSAVATAICPGESDSTVVAPRRAHNLVVNDYPAVMIDLSILRLVAITDNIRDGQTGLIARATAAVHGGATCVQLRLKDVAARDLVGVARELIRCVGVPVIVNDRADVAIAAGAAGVHLGADDVPVSAIRAIAPKGFLIGASVGSDAEVPPAAGADYVGVGPVFATSSKNDAGNPIGLLEFARLSAATGLPTVAIGGITAANALSAIQAGAAGIAVISSIFGATDPRSAAQELASAIGM